MRASAAVATSARTVIGPNGSSCSQLGLAALVELEQREQR